MKRLQNLASIYISTCILIPINLLLALLFLPENCLTEDEKILAKTRISSLLTEKLDLKLAPELIRAWILVRPVKILKFLKILLPLALTFQLPLARASQKLGSPSAGNKLFPGKPESRKTRKFLRSPLIFLIYLKSVTSVNSVRWKSLILRSQI